MNMTKEDVIRMAQEAGIPFNKYDLIGCDSCERDIDAELHRFAALVANDVLEAAALMCMDMNRGWCSDDRIECAAVIRTMKAAMP